MPDDIDIPAHARPHISLFSYSSPFSVPVFAAMENVYLLIFVKDAFAVPSDKVLQLETHETPTCHTAYH